MKAKRNFNLQKKFFLILFAILLINVIIVVLFSGTFLEKTYITSTKGKLNDLHSKIEIAYKKNDLNQLNDLFFDCSENNITVLIYDSVRNKTIYSTLRGKNGDKYDSKDAINWINWALSNNLFSSISGSEPIIMSTKNELGDSIDLYSILEDGSYLMMETPSAYIKGASKISTEFFIILSLITLLIGSSILFFIIRKLIKPIKEIDSTAKEITKLNFTKKCKVNTGDELQTLAESINLMSDRLKQNINILKDDLKRQEQTNKLRRDFIANISHDLKTPLTLILSYVGGLNGGKIENEKAKEVINNQIDKMDRLVNETLTLSRLESKTTTYNMAPFQISEIIYATLDEFRIIIENDEIKLKKDIDQEIIVNGDYYYLKQSFSNYLENAIKYIDGNKELEVRVKKEGENVIVEVINTSTRVAENENLNELYEMYYKADESRNENARSYGIGLAIVKNVIEVHGGEVGASYKNNKIKFYFKLKVYK